ncbi:hypothetical protein T484DRAFT_1899763 [Baffinella frigidus]|nr:hypothetical protein T484DRAFT_1899763 [Cryptophyta sp. CCMP2293]
MEGFTGANGVACIACPAGSYKDTTGTGVCTLCAENKYSTVAASADPTTCLSCPTFTFAMEGSNELTDCTCLAGYSASNAGTACGACPPGTTKPAAGTGTCSACPAATYSGVEAHASACTVCPAATSSPGGSVAVAACTCLPGYTGADGVACSACPAGTWKAAAGSGGCTACGADRYSAGVARTGVDECSECAAHASAPPSSDNKTVCVCDDAYFGPLGGPCALCLQNQWCQGGATFNCPQSSTSPAGSSDLLHCKCFPGFIGAPGGPCQTCALDQYCPGGDEEISCPALTFSLGGSDVVTDCTCLPGYKGAAGGPCSECQTGQYCSGGKATVCPLNANSPSGSVEITSCQCRPGYYGANGDACAPCPANWYCIGGNASAACPAHAGSPARSAEWDACTCLKGWYATGFSCTKCDAGSFCFAGGKYACPPQLPNSPAGAGTLSECTLPNAVAQEAEAPSTTPVSEEDRRAVDLLCSKQECASGNFRAPCVSGQALCGTCKGLPTHAHFTTPGSPFDSDNCIWACNSGYGVVSSGVCTLLPTTKVVAITTTLQMTAAEFENIKGDFIAAIAVKMGVDVEAVVITKVVITKVTETLVRRRMLLASSSVDVDFTVTGIASSPGDACAGFDPSSIGLGVTASVKSCVDDSPEPAVAPPTSSNTAADTAGSANGFKLDTMTVALIGGAMLLLILFAVVGIVLMCRPRGHSSKVSAKPSTGTRFLPRSESGRSSPGRGVPRTAWSSDLRRPSSLGFSRRSSASNVVPFDNSMNDLAGDKKQLAEFFSAKGGDVLCM